MKKTQRIYYLDFIRAIAMIAGIFFHSSLSFLKDPVKHWPIYDEQTSLGIIDLFTWASHRMRMPLFFLVCGYFTFMLLKKYDLKVFIKNRYKKILIPLLISLAVIVPISIDSFIMDTRFAPYAQSRLEHFSLMHLWFLYYLVIFYALILPIYKKLNDLLTSESKIKNLLFIFGISIAIFSMKDPASINATSSFKPDPVAFAFYFIFFLSGAYFFNNNELFTNLYNKKTKLLFGASFILAPVTLLFKNQDLNILTNTLTTVFTITSIIVVMEFTKRVFNKESKAIRYISDSSYWLYLIHIPVVVSIQKLTLELNTTKEVKFLITSIATLGVLLASYQLLVRYTIIGTYLHGKRNKDESTKKNLAWS